jgi:hypothetical protein
MMSPSIDSSSNNFADNKHVVQAYTRPKATSTILREYLEDPDKIIVGPGVYDGLTARMALQAGFDTLYMVNTTKSCFEFRS